MITKADVDRLDLSERVLTLGGDGRHRRPPVENLRLIENEIAILRKMSDEPERRAGRGQGISQQDELDRSWDSAYATTMTDLSAAAIDLLRVLDKQGPRQIDQIPELETLWQNRFVMGNKFKTCITGQGQRFIRAFDTEQRH